jgi:hypothetical protein
MYRWEWNRERKGSNFILYFCSSSLPPLNQDSLQVTSHTGERFFIPINDVILSFFLLFLLFLLSLRVIVIIWLFW